MIVGSLKKEKKRNADLVYMKPKENAGLEQTMLCCETKALSMHLLSEPEKICPIQKKKKCKCK